MDVVETDLAEETITPYTTSYDDHIDDTDDDAAKSAGFRCLQVIKSTALGLGAPQGISLEVKAIDNRGIGFRSLFRTTNLAWMKQGFFLPPSFKVHRRSASTEASLPHEYGPLVASVKYRGMEGLFHMKADLSVFRSTKDLDIGSDRIETQQRHQLRIYRGGWARQYTVAAPNEPGMEHIWKGTKQALNVLHDSAPDCNGNLKLLNENLSPPKILAVWKNRTDPKIMGALWVSERALEAREIVLEDVLCSCLAIICSERLNSRGWLGGATHSRRRSTAGWAVA